MTIQIYSESEVSEQDKLRCLEGFTDLRGKKYACINRFYVIYRDMQTSVVFELCDIILTSV
jgi:hypothetical protein